MERRLALMAQSESTNNPTKKVIHGCKRKSEFKDLCIHACHHSRQSDMICALKNFSSIKEMKEVYSILKPELGIQ